MDQCCQDEARTGFRQQEEASPPDGAARWCDLVVPASEGQPPVRVRCHRLDRASRGVIVWAHGGSWVSGSVEAWHEPCAALADACDLAVIGVEYRLAPRWPFPAPLEDLMRVLHWAATAFAADGRPPYLAVGGDSAGGTLAASAALRCREDGPSLTAQILAYPPLDPSCSQPSYLRQPPSYPSRELMLDAWAAYRGTGSRSQTGDLLTPWDAADLSRLPPALVGFGEFDPVAGDSLTYADRLAAHGTPVSVRSFAGLGHASFFHRATDGSFPLQDWIAATLPHPQPLDGRRAPDHRSRP